MSPNSSTAKTPWKRSENRFAKVQESSNILLVGNTPKHLTVGADFFAFLFDSFLVLQKYVFTLYEETYKWGGNPSRKQGKFLGAKKSFSTVRKYWAKEVVS